MNTRKIEISIIIPTKNVANIIEPCLNSIFSQSGVHFEVLVIDNFSSDLSKDIISNYEEVRFYQIGPERNVQRRFGAEKAKGNFLFFIDADMELSDGLLKEARSIMQDKKIDAIIIPEDPWGAHNFWTKCKILERGLYKNDDQIEAARFFRKSSYERIGGFDKDMISMEDWDLTQKLRKADGVILRTKSSIKHNEGIVSLANIWNKKKYYGGKASSYVSKRGILPVLKKIYFFRPSFWKNLPTIFKDPVLGFGLVFLLFFELFAGANGFLKSYFKK